MSEAAIVAECPAKINLALRVLGRRPDGYHELDTVFQAIDLWDTLSASDAETLTLECDHPEVPTDSSNLVLRAAEALRRVDGAAGRGARLTLTKRIPVGAGLGGGSSDGAAALRLLARLWGLDPGHAELRRLAAGLGADVPFFLVGGRARGRERGDRVEPLEFPGSEPLVLGFPPFGLGTAEVYLRYSERLTLPENDVSLSHLFPHKLRQEKDLGFAVNDLERVVFEDRPELARFRDALVEEGAARALLSGSGAAVYGLFESGARPDETRRRLAGRFEGWTVISSRTIGEGVRLGP